MAITARARPRAVPVTAAPPRRWVAGNARLSGAAGRVPRGAGPGSRPRTRRSRSRRNRRFGERDFRPVVSLLRQQWSPEQISGYLDLTGQLSISHETIYRYVWRDWSEGGVLYRELRGARKQRRKRYRSYDSRGRLPGKRHISERPAAATRRSRRGHWEIDTVIGAGSRHCIVTLVEGKTRSLSFVNA